MKIRAECIPCQLRRALFEASLVGGSDENEVMRTAIGIFDQYFPPPEGILSFLRVCTARRDRFRIPRESPPEFH